MRFPCPSFETALWSVSIWKFDLKASRSAGGSCFQNGWHGQISQIILRCGPAADPQVHSRQTVCQMQDWQQRQSRRNLQTHLRVLLRGQKPTRIGDERLKKGTFVSTSSALGSKRRYV